ncbi:MAG: glycosyltransferase [Solobacterium sp.]|nr:glycosyltransferase [Solobacterium sp.]
MKYPDYSVLMSVYQKEKAEHLRTAMNSMWEQTVVTNDFVLICDGKLTDELDEVISGMLSAHPDTLHVIRFEKNRGLGYALKTGVMECRNDIIARMDSDDISRPERCEKELQVLLDHPEISIVGSVIEEFTEIEEGSMRPMSVTSKRVVPEFQENIISFAKTRNPFNHPSVMFRKNAVADAGNYQDVRYMQDYYLWTHMLIKGYKGYNIQEPLVWMRADSSLYKRRSGKLYRDIQMNLFRYMRDQGFITNTQYLKSAVIRTGSSFAPNWLRKFLFQKILRKH